MDLLTPISALGGTIGTGLFLGIGKAFVSSGPLSVLLGYSLTGVAIYAMMQCLGEMATWLPLPGAVPQYCARYVDPALGFAVGWNNWISNSLTLCAEISAAAIVIGFWNDTINQAAWITLILALIICLNIFAVSIYGEAEFIFASVKIITIVGLLLLAFIIDLGGSPDQGRLGFRYWSEPWAAMKAYVGVGNTGRFAGLFATLVNAAFSYGGVEMVAVAAGEAENPRKNIPKAVKRVFWRILFFYVLGSIAIGVIVPADDDRLLSGGAGAASSPWVIGIVRAGIPVLPHIINAVILTSAASSGNAFLYTGSRYLFALAQNGQAPKVFLTCTKAGVPVYCVLITASVGLLTFMTVSSGANNVFGWFQTVSSRLERFPLPPLDQSRLTERKTANNDHLPLHLDLHPHRFHRLPQGLRRARRHARRPSLQLQVPALHSLHGPGLLHHDRRLQRLESLHPRRRDRRVQLVDPGLCHCVSLLVSPLALHFSILLTRSSRYVVIPIYLGLFIFWKLYKKTKFVKASEADLWTGKAALDAEVWPEQVPRNFLEKVWFWIA